MGKKLLLGAIALSPLATFAEGVTVNPPVDMTSYITAGVTALGTVVAAAVGAYVSFLLIRKGIRWVRTCLSA